MAGKVYTVQVNDEKLVSSVSSKQADVVVKAAQKEVENYGIVEINNNSAKSKVKNVNEVGFEKNVTLVERKAVKNKISKVDNYFDFSFRPEETKKTSTKKKVSKKAAEVSVKNVNETAATAKVETVDDVQTIPSVLKSEIVEHRQISVEARACDRFRYDEEVKKVMSIAREGALFG